MAVIANRTAMDVVAITDHDTTEGAFIALDYARQYYPKLEIIVGLLIIQPSRICIPRLK